MIQNLTLGIIFLKTLFWPYKFFIFLHTFQWTLSELFSISDFLTESLKANKTSEKDHSFYNTVSLKKTSLLSESQLFDIENNMLSKHYQKIFSAYKFSSKNASV